MLLLPSNYEEIRFQLLEENDQDTNQHLNDENSLLPQEYLNEYLEITDKTLAYLWYREKLFIQLFNLESKNEIPIFSTVQNYVESINRGRIAETQTIQRLGHSYQNQSFIRVSEILNDYIFRSATSEQAAGVLLQKWHEITTKIKNELESEIP